MAELTANHKFILQEIGYQKERYEHALSEFSRLEQKWKEKPDDMEILLLLHKSSNDLQGLKYSLALNISAYLEAMINFYLVTNMDANQFKAIEICSMEDKWMNILPMIETNYVFPRSGALEQGLKTLKKARNAITHMKPMIKNESNLAHKGLNPDQIKHDQTDRNDISLWIQLPSMLLSEMEKYIAEPKLRSVKFFGGFV
jgi:hypothetical protein